MKSAMVVRISYLFTFFLVVYWFWNGKIDYALSVIGIALGLFYWVENRKEELKRTQRNKRLEFLEDSYKKLAMGVKRCPNREYNKKFQEGLEEAVALIQLYGEKELIQMLIKQFPNFDLVLNELRNSLREEFELEKVEDKIIPCRSLDEEKGIEEYMDKENNLHLKS